VIVRQSRLHGSTTCIQPPSHAGSASSWRRDQRSSARMVLSRSTRRRSRKWNDCWAGRRWRSPCYAVLWTTARDRGEGYDREGEHFSIRFERDAAHDHSAFWTMITTHPGASVISLVTYDSFSNSSAQVQFSSSRNLSEAPRPNKGRGASLRLRLSGLPPPLLHLERGRHRRSWSLLLRLPCRALP